MKNIFLLICIFVFVSPLEILALKRNKRNTELNPIHHKIKQDFVKLNAGKKDFENEVKTDVKVNEKDSHPDDILESMKANTTHNLKPVHHHRSNSTKRRNVTSPLANLKKYHAQSYRSQMLPLVKESANIVGIPIQLYSPLSPLTPPDQMMNLVNTLMFKVGLDSMSPYRAQSQLTYSPNEFSSPNAKYQEKYFNNDIEPGLEFIINSIEGPQYNSLLNVPSNNIEKSRTVIYSTPLVFKKPIKINEPKQLIDLIGNALDFEISKMDEGLQGKGEKNIYCPIQHEKKNVKAAKSGLKEKDNANQVDSGSFIKSSKKELLK